MSRLPKAELLRRIQEHTGLAIEAVDEKGDNKKAIHHLIWVTAWLTEQIFNDDMEKRILSKSIKKKV